MIFSLQPLKGEFLLLFDLPVLKPPGEDVPEPFPVVPGMGENIKRRKCAGMSFLLDGDHGLGQIMCFCKRMHSCSRIPCSKR